MNHITTNMSNLNLDANYSITLIKTIRFKKLIKQVQSFIEFYHLNNNYLNVIITIIYKESIAQTRIPPEFVLFDKSKIYQILDLLRLKIEQNLLEDFLNEYMQSI